MRRIIREQEPPKPSTALHAMAPNDLTTVARHRQSEAPKLIHATRGDLDWIVMKALEKDRARRYETANGFARDVQRDHHRSGHPLSLGRRDHDDGEAEAGAAIRDQPAHSRLGEE
jgi:hypothetical protein